MAGAVAIETSLIIIGGFFVGRLCVKCKSVDPGVQKSILSILNIDSETGHLAQDYIPRS